MAGLSSTLYDTGSIEIIGGHSAAATSGSDGNGRALSDLGHSSGRWYAEVLLAAVRSSGEQYWGVAALRNTGSLTVGLGVDSDAGYYAGFSSVIRQYVSASFGQSLGVIQPTTVGQRIRIWVDAAAGKMWLSARPYVGGTWGGVYPPSSGVGQVWDIPGSGAIRIALRPANGSGSDRNVLRFLSRYSEIDATDVELDGARPWDARQVVINLVVRESIGGAHIAEGTAVSYAVFEGLTPGTLSTPTTVGTATIGAAGALALPAWISVDPGAPISVLVSTTAGTPGTQARSHYMPVIAP